MRLDKYLKVSRIIKRRTVANEACDSGRVMLNDKVARASAEVKAGDVIEIAFGTKAVKVKVTSVQDAIRKEDAKEMFEALKKEQIYVRYFKTPGLDNSLRISIGTDEEMDTLFRFLEAYLPNA